MKNGQDKTSIQPLSFWPAFICMAVFIFAGIMFTDQMGGFLNGVLDTISARFGWLFMISGLIAFFTIIYLLFSKYGDIRLGGKDAKPDLSLWQWFSICLCSGIGTGLLFWASAEPMFFFAEPAQAWNVEPFSREAGITAISQTAFHWTIMQYSMYTICALAVAMVVYSRDESYSVSTTLYGLLGKKHSGVVGTIINAVCIFTLGGAVASSLGGALLLIASGLENVFGIESGNFVWLITAVVITVVFTTSSISGMKKGLSMIADANTKIFIGLAIFVLIFGPSIFIADIGVTAFGDFLTKFFNKATITNAMTTDEWAKGWTVQFWASFFVVAPLIGLFYARLGRGRTVREFIAMTLFGPSLFCFVWIAIFGGSAIHLQSTGTLDIWANIQTNGMASTVFAIFGSLPLAKVTMVIFIIAIIASLVTYADPMTSVLATLSCKSSSVDEEAPKYLKLIWGPAIGTVGYIIIATGGIDGIRGMFTLIGFPLMFLVLAICVSAVKTARMLVAKEEPGSAASENASDASQAK
ncbi:BCCT family transporter [Polycladidibacter stylochi]|uniref:BCCT family transporter n=1 Tax=Polycladidibacter stylochi TaxID=1807766 RepID=UPI00083073F2|nr:BCCT family transporter [Pseudovibrio stylochi]